MDRDELRRTAAALGLTRLEDKHLDQLAAGMKSTRALADRLPKDLHWTDEAAHVFSLTGRGGGR
jgi:ABC-type transport system involved in cytochrome c biogenesis ATPase subunit